MFCVVCCVLCVVESETRNKFKRFKKKGQQIRLKKYLILRIQEDHLKNHTNRPQEAPKKKKKFSPRKKKMSLNFLPP